MVLTSVKLLLNETNRNLVVQSAVYPALRPIDFLLLPRPQGSEENQFTPPGAGVNKLIFGRRVQLR